MGGAGGSGTALLILVALVSLLPLLVAIVRQDRLVSLRGEPGDALLVAVPVLATWWVSPWLGVLAAQGGLWWWWNGYPRLHGGLLWPLVAWGLWLGLQAPPWAMRASLALVLAMGVAHVALAVGQRCRQPWFHMEEYPGGPPVCHGIIGHRTGLSIFLAVLMPLAFILPPIWAWSLVIMYGVGVWLARASVGALAAGAGLLWVMPAFWPVTVIATLVGVAGRFLEKGDTGWYIGWRQLDPRISGALGTRVEIWRATVSALWRDVPLAVLGHGPGAFTQDAKTWTSREGFGQHYREAHNDYLEFLYDQGFVGLVAAGGFLWSLRAGWGGLGDPLTGAALAFGVAMSLNFPARVGSLAALGLLILVAVAREATWGAAW